MEAMLNTFMLITLIMLTTPLLLHYQKNLNPS